MVNQFVEDFLRVLHVFVLDYCLTVFFILELINCELEMNSRDIQ